MHVSNQPINIEFRKAIYSLFLFNTNSPFKINKVIFIWKIFTFIYKHDMIRLY